MSVPFIPIQMNKTWSMGKVTQSWRWNHHRLLSVSPILCLAVHQRRAPFAVPDVKTVKTKERKQKQKREILMEMKPIGCTGIFCPVAKHTTWIQISLRFWRRVELGRKWTKVFAPKEGKTCACAREYRKNSGFWFLILKGGVAFFVRTGLTWMAFGSRKRIKLL